VWDFNGDAHLDLAVVNTSENTVSILLGNADGSFQAATSYTVGAKPWFVAVGDFNGDGHLDLVAANGGTEPHYTDGGVSILLGNGDGTFQAAQNYEVGSGPTSVLVEDFNGDGHLDLVVVGSQSGYVNVLLGNGDGTFQGTQTIAVGHELLSVSVGDFNDDGHLDLVVLNGDLDTVSILLGNGDGTFQTARSYDAAGNSSLAVGDFNGDGHLDLAVTNDFVGESSVAVLLGNGDGSFQAPKSYATWGANSIAVGDFNKDGHLDLAVAAPGSPVSIFLGNGDGTFHDSSRGVPGVAEDTILVIRDAGLDREAARVPEEGTGDVGCRNGTGRGLRLSHIAVFLLLARCGKTGRLPGKLFLEVHYRRLRGEAPQTSEYLARFPELPTKSAKVCSAWGSFTSGPCRTAPSRMARESCWS
jgi:hypothetical protein